MLVEIAIGDAYGAGMEYVNARHIKENNNLTSYCQHPRHTITPGNYTDDAQMSIAIAEMIVTDTAWTKINIATLFLNAFKRDPREGYAQGFYGFLVKTNNAKEFLDNIISNSDKSGAAMRSSPIGIFPSISDVIEKAKLQASVTHDSTIGINSAVAVALMSHYFLYQLGPKQQLGLFLEQHVDGEWNKPWHGKVGAKGDMSVRAAITAISNADSLKDILKLSINFGGDVDTVAAIAMGAASACKNIRKDIPDSLINTLENSNYGRDFLVNLDKKLLDKFMQFSLK